MDDFVPDNYVPISAVVRCEAAGTSERLTVSRPLLEALTERGHRLYLAWSEGMEICYTAELTVDLAQGEVRFLAQGQGPHAIVAETIVHAYPVTTHWSAAMNGGRGGFQPGASDGLGQIGWDAREGRRTIEGQFRCDDERSPYYFRSERYALWPDDPDARTMAYERYIGETYSLYSVSEAAALRLSAEALAHSGYPALLRRTDTPLAELEGVPAFQLVHNVIIGEGAHRSLATYILPPHWQRGAADYPAVFSGFYDQNENVFSTVGPDMLRLIGELYTERGAGVVGIIWNGGGSIGTRTLQQSIYANLDALFERAIRDFGVREDGIVTVGGSRGGFASLLAAANPSRQTYRVRYAVCANVPFLIGTPLLTMLNSTHPILDQAMCEDTGYKDAWRKDWRDEQGRSGMERFLETTVGTSELAEIDEARSPASETVMRRLAANGTQVLQSHGTHDPFTASWLAYRWVDRARALGIPVRHEIGYRFGHNNCVPPMASAKRCLESIVSGEPLEMAGDYHYVRASEEPADWSRAALLEVERQPLFLEAPKVVVRGAANDFTFYGVPGMDYRLTLMPVQAPTSGEVGEVGEVGGVGRGGDGSDSGVNGGGCDSDDGGEGNGSHRNNDGYCCDGNDGCDSGDAASAAGEVVVMEGRLEALPALRPGFSYAVCYRDITAELPGDAYRYRLRYRLPGAAGWSEGLPHTPQPDHPEPMLTVLETQPNPLQPEWIGMTLQHFIGWGLSEV
ncbi:hypothetical protein PA598K_03453 [Paenibacillus sp. 598K]|nr:hypothetical protein PA598K_03453 [Paenibacillus sp. 598K]